MQKLMFAVVVCCRN